MSAPTGIPSPSKRRLFCCGTLWSRYPSVWDHHLAPLNAINCGIRGDRTQNVMWQVDHMYLPATVSVGVIHCGINDINEASTHADIPHEIAESVILCGSKLKARHPLMSIIIVGILPIEEAFGGRKSSQIDKVNKILEESCQSHSFLFVEQARCWKDPSSGDINQSLFWLDVLHLNKKGCSMLSKIYADNIHNLLQSATCQPHHYQPSTQDSSTIPPTPMSSCSYVHVPPPETTYSPNVAVHHHHCHNRTHKDKRRCYQRFLNTNVESKSKSKSKRK